MDRCASCGAALDAGASWCGQCYALTTAPALVGAPAGGPVPQAEPVEVVDRFGIRRTVSAEEAAALAAPALPTQSGPRQPWPFGTPNRTQPDPNAPSSRRAVIAVACAIGIGAVYHVVMWLLSRNGDVEPEALVRWDLVGALAVYAAVVGILMTQLGDRSRLRWRDGPPLTGIGLGVLVGGAAAAVLVGLNSLITGHLSTDPTATMLVSEGDVAHILATVLVVCIAAPFCEELLFRGVLAESLRYRGQAAAIWLSALAFAAWHLRPEALRYYALMGAVLGLLYWKRGLVASIGAHLTFNGVLTGIAVALALSPAHVVTAGLLSTEAPRGWHTALDHTVGQADLILGGPSGAEFVVLHEQTPVPVPIDEVLQRLRSSPTPGGGAVTDPSSARLQQTPAGTLARIDITVKGHSGVVAVLPEPSSSGDLVYTIVFASGGSAKAQTDFESMLQRLQIGTASSS